MRTDPDSCIRVINKKEHFFRTCIMMFKSVLVFSVTLLPLVNKSVSSTLTIVLLLIYLVVAGHLILSMNGFDDFIDFSVRMSIFLTAVLTYLSIQFSNVIYRDKDVLRIIQCVNWINIFVMVVLVLLSFGFVRNFFKNYFHHIRIPKQIEQQERFCSGEKCSIVFKC